MGGASRERTHVDQSLRIRTLQKHAKVAECVSKRILRGKNIPLFLGATFQSNEGIAVLFQDYVENNLAIAANGALKLPTDAEIHS